VISSIVPALPPPPLPPTAHRSSPSEAPALWRQQQKGRRRPRQKQRLGRSRTQGGSFCGNVQGYAFMYILSVLPPSPPSLPSYIRLIPPFLALKLLFTLFCKLYPCVFLMLYYLTRILPRRFPFPLTPLSYFHSIPSSPSLPPSPAQARMHPPRQVRPRLPGAQNIQWSVPPGASGGSRRHFGGGSWEGDCQFVC